MNNKPQTINLYGPELDNYLVAIASYNRPQTLKNKTMNLLQKNNIDPKKVHIFVANNKEKKEYENTLDKNSYNKIVVGKKGIKNIRNFMPKYFKEGQKIFYIDDDIYKLFKAYNNNEGKVIDGIDKNYDRKYNRLREENNLDKIIKEGFEQAKNEIRSKQFYFNNVHDNMNNVWHFDRHVRQGNEGGHATPKPIPLCERVIKSSCPDGGLVIDSFLGSGSTMVASHQLKRKCYGMELDPKYCQVIIDRMKKLDDTLQIKINGKEYGGS